jgi:hypothetical protein
VLPDDDADSDNQNKNVNPTFLSDSRLSETFESGLRDYEGSKDNKPNHTSFNPYEILAHLL